MAPAPARALPAARRAWGSSWRARSARRRLGADGRRELGSFEQQQSRGRAADLAGQHQEVALPRSAAGDEQLSARRVADHGDRDGEHRGTGDVAAG